MSGYKVTTTEESTRRSIARGTTMKDTMKNRVGGGEMQRVHFPDNPVTTVWSRPRTEAEELPYMYYNNADYASFTKEVSTETEAVELGNIFGGGEGGGRYCGGIGGGGSGYL
jgi:hypothetical protein